MNIFLIALLPILVLSIQFQWDLRLHLDNVEYGRNFVSQYSLDGVAHFFWIETNKGSLRLLYQALHPNKTLTERKTISTGTHLLKISPTVTAQVSNDGKHVLAAYTGYRVSPETSCDDNSRNSCFEIFFTESINSGKDWDEPIRMNREDMNDVKHRSYPAMLLEKDTGRVYIGYNTYNNLTISIREPGNKKFEMEYMLPNKTFAEGMALGYTIDKKNSIRYIHWFWTTLSYETLYYKYSIDNGKTWTNDMTLLQSVTIKKPPAIAINTEALEGGIHIQYFQKHDTIRQDVRMIWSKDHGKLWEGPQVLDETYYNANSINMCGNKEQAFIISSNMETMVTPGYIRFVPIQGSNAYDIPYPFNQVDFATSGYSDISCVHIGNEKYLVTHMVLDNEAKSLYLAHGVFNHTS